LVIVVGLSSAVMFAFVSPASGSAHNHPPLAPGNLTVDDDRAPLAVDGAPQFGWWVNDRDPNEIQRAYELVVRDGDRAIFDSGRVASSQQSYVEAPGLRLEPDHRYGWIVRTWDHDESVGPYAPEAFFDTALRDRDWKAEWIRRAGAEQQASEDYSLFRKDVRIGASPITRAVVQAAAGQQYELYVNGARLAHGPSFSYPDQQYYETTDVSGALRAGATNAIGLLTHWSTPGQGRPASVPAVIARIVVQHADDTVEIATTNATWQTHTGYWQPAALRNDEGDFVEHLDERAVPAGWPTGALDNSWSAATVVGAHPVAPFTHLIPARSHVVFLPYPPTSVRRLADGAIVADFGAVRAATPVVHVRAGRAGRAVKVVGGYLLDPDGHVSTTRGVQETDMHWDFDERAGDQVLRPFGYLGFRYLEIDGAGALKDADITADTRHADMPDERTAIFRSSNATLDAIWNLARNSALFDTQEQFLDTPTREKGPFLQDSFDVSQATMAAFGERAITAQALRDFALSQARYWPDGRVNVVYPNGDGRRDIPDATETFVQWVWHAYEVSGDRAQLAALFPVVNNIVDYIKRAIDPHTGLVTNLPGGGSDYLYGAVDWPPTMRYGYDMNTVARTTMNVLAADDFARVADMAKILGRERDVHVDATPLVAAIHQHLQRKDGIYVDGLEADGSPSTHASQQANAYALAFGLVPPENVKTVADHIVALKTNMGVVNFRVLLDALHRAGRDDALVTELTDPSRPGYAQILHEGATFTWESWIARQNGDSESHGWGATVLAVLQDDILGVHVDAPGASHVDISLPESSVTMAQGVLPTQRGPIEITWRRMPNQETVDVLLPVNVTATLHFPGQPARTIGAGRFRIPEPSASTKSSKSGVVGVGAATVATIATVALICAFAFRRRRRRQRAR
jgi:alpha-L-rhamnosidase